LAGSRGTVWDAVYLGTVVTITHTASVFVLGLATLYASQHIQMERIYAWLSIFSGALIVLIGGGLLWSRWKALRAGPQAEAHSHDHAHSHSHGLKGWLTHSHSHDEHGHSHGPEHSHEGHSHDHEHGLTHSHSHGDPGHSHDHEHADGHGHSHDGHAHDGHAHDHGHSHPQPKLARAGRGSLLTLGISGGLVPCPEAMVVLLISITINRLLFGIVILIAFSLGLAAILIAIGVAMVLAGPTLSRFTKDGPLLRVLPVGSAVLVTLLGVAILFSAVNDAGMLRF
jgi:ABC-type nickel/cobalt efflux system permease component RcnA